MSADVIDISGALEERKFQQKENRLKVLKEAFRAARLEAKAAKKTRSGSSSSSRKKKHKNPPR
ncbi:MAG: hypothetical protein WBJ75_06775 [Pseudohongiellaceae bacterium]|nr:MAG: hypothetical protein A3H44_03740 [Gammaproteobacteria bacterium RIFCSPLOWO2_02_FULL_57_10]